MTTPDPALVLPTHEEGGMRCCHVCRAWRPTEHVRDLRGVPTCTTCKPDRKLDPRPHEEPALESDRDRLRHADAAPKRRRKAKT